MSERYETHYDSLEGHWGWWVRIEGHFIQIPPAKQLECDAKVKAAVASPENARGIPYTTHLLHVKLRR